MEWIALKHALLSHLPVATGLLLPLPLLAAQRPGRGIRPWWTVARYLGAVGLIGTLLALLSGLATARNQGLFPLGRMVSAWSGTGAEAELSRHFLFGVVGLFLGTAALWAMTRPRKDHQSIGVLALILGVLWSAVLLLGGEAGYTVAHGAKHQAPVPQAAVPAPLPRSPEDPEAKAPLRALDYASLEPIRAEPVKSPAHGGRWIRVWATPQAAAAYREGQPLPLGALVVMSTLEDRWGRPGTEPGPIYALEMKEGGSALTFYWPQVPDARREETDGEARAYWRGQNTHLEACRRCHATGMADPAQRSRWRIPKRVVTPE
jgi:hypothetical protein